MTKGLIRGRAGLISLSFGLGCLICQFAANGWAQSYPVKTVRFVVNQSAGSGSDTIGRIAVAGLTQVFGQQVIVENRAGAAGNIGAEIKSGREQAPDRSRLHCRG